MNDLYTKAMLTAIAAFLGAIAFPRAVPKLKILCLRAVGFLKIAACRLKANAATHRKKLLAAASAVFFVGLVIGGQQVYEAATEHSSTLGQENPYDKVAERLFKPASERVDPAENAVRDPAGAPGYVAPPLQDNVPQPSSNRRGPHQEDELDDFYNLIFQSVHNGQYGLLAAVLTFALVLTCAVGLTPPFIIRFAVLRRPLEKWPAIGVCFLFLVINCSILIELNGHGSHSPRAEGVGMVALVSYWILRRPARVQKLAALEQSETWGHPPRK